jgi:uncharacterized Ntn-hydrolase superfamily protein
MRAMVTVWTSLLLAALPTHDAAGPRPVMAPRTVSTFSIVAIDPANGDLGVAVASRYFSVGSVVPWALAGVGAVATQANVNVGYGPQGIDLLRQGLTAPQVLKKLLSEDAFEGKDGRQIAVVDAHGNVATYTGPKAPSWAGDRQGPTWSAQGNILAGPQVVEAMGKAFDSTPGELAEKLYAALKAGDDAGGDARGHQSASLLVVRKRGGRNLNNDRYVYINVDDNPKPLVELRRLLDLNLSYLYQEAAERLLGEGKGAEAVAAARKAVAYTPRASDAHLELAFLEYVAGDRATARGEFLEAKRLDPDFRKQLEASLDWTPAFRVVRDDEALMKELLAAP